MGKTTDTKPKLKPVEGYDGLFVYEGLKRNPTARRKEIYYAVAGATRQNFGKQGLTKPSNSK